MTEERPVFSNNLCKSINLSSFRNIIFKAATCVSCLFQVLQVFTLDMVCHNKVRFDKTFLKKLTPTKACRKCPSRIVLEILNNILRRTLFLLKFEAFSLLDYKSGIKFSQQLYAKQLSS